MITRCLRIRQPREFQRVRKRGRSWTTPYLVLVKHPNHLDHNRYGFAVGRRVGKAARRNRIKRWMREAVRHRHPEWDQGYDVILIARGKMANPSANFHTVTESVGILASRAGLARSGEHSVDETRDQT